MWLSGHPPFPPHACCEQLDLQSDSQTGSPCSARLPPAVCICACDGARHVTAACFAASVSELSSQQTTSWGCWCLFQALRSGHKTSPPLSPCKLTLLWICLIWLLPFIICLAQICVGCLCFPVFLLSLLSNCFPVTWPDSWLGQMSLSHSAVHPDDVSPARRLVVRTCAFFVRTTSARI